MCDGIYSLKGSLFDLFVYETAKINVYEIRPIGGGSAKVGTQTAINTSHFKFLEIIK